MWFNILIETGFGGPNGDDRCGNLIKKGKFVISFGKSGQDQTRSGLAG